MPVWPAAWMSTAAHHGLLFRDLTHAKDTLVVGIDGGLAGVVGSCTQVCAEVPVRQCYRPWSGTPDTMVLGVIAEATGAQ